jgi:alcohol dehydrogenase class IV
MTFSIYMPTKIIYNRPVVETLPAALAELHATRVLLVNDPVVGQLGWVERIGARLRAAGCRLASFSQVSSNPTSREVAAGLEVARSQATEAVVALGGGSVLDVAKAIAMLAANGGSYADYLLDGRSIAQRSLPLLAVPTTAGSGSEVSKATAIVVPESPARQWLASPLMYPTLALLDPELTRSLPAFSTAATGIHALAHALEVYLGRQANLFTDQLAVTALQAAWMFLPRAVADGNDVAARRGMLLAALWAGIATDQAGLGLVHALSGPLTTHLHCHEGVANALVLPHALRFNLPAVSSTRRQRLNRLFGLPAEADGEALSGRLSQFITYLQLPTRLSELGMPLDGFDWEALAAEAMRMNSIANNPYPATASDCEAMLAQVRQ